MVFIDHQLLNLLFKTSEPPGRLNRWRLQLAEFDLEIKYKKGGDNHHAVALSGLLTGSPTIVHDNDDILAFQLCEENDLNISSSTITFNRSQLENQNYDEEEGFLEPGYGKYDQVLITHDVRSHISGELDKIFKINIF